MIDATVFSFLFTKGTAQHDGKSPLLTAAWGIELNLMEYEEIVPSQKTTEYAQLEEVSNVQHRLKIVAGMGTCDISIIWRINE